MGTQTRGVTFYFDESYIEENPRLNVPLSIVKNESRSVSIFNKYLYDLNVSYKKSDSLLSINKHDAGANLENVNRRSSSSVKKHEESSYTRKDSSKFRTGYPDTKNIEDLVESNIVKSKQVYNRLINDALEELENLERAERELREKELKEKLEREKKIKEEEERQKELERLKNEQEEAENRGGIGSATSNVESSSVNVLFNEQDYVPKNNTVKIYEDITDSFNEYDKQYNEIKANSTLKRNRIDISKRVTACLNGLANTEKQIQLIFDRLAQMLTEFPQMKLFIAFKIIEGILNCCEEGCQIYINNKSAWSFSRILQKLVELDQTFSTIYLKLISAKCIFAIPRFYVSKSQTPGSVTSADASNIANNGSVGADVAALCKIYGYELSNSSSDIKYNKRLKSFLTLHLAFFVVRKDYRSIWSFYSNVVNASWDNVLLPVVPNILITLLTTTSYFMLGAYQIQFRKILVNIVQLLNSRLNNLMYTASFQMYRGQVEEFIQQFNSKGKFDVPEGYSLKYKEEELRRDV
ncbi:conserved hypothetical protein [Theileria orientalis strain Shintoku]|uniref:Nucleoporin GLE1 n=1 Tax=Theileria orientalis strain Shintoku TaxID=869250 RepID=J4CC95_THEOR|nr:conserved hypothetical protein [Theileria orientalis strain Shintoku]PVC51818.1 hypothetical protein MACL_00001265 [Theileria orientalis]BAM39002.1 conserved hypothetical protein [Theileria orientalis strain Shintoku]|eukprot:XP_009689303.1 conserved hypothetical protein [Theileria orientalis strain Shintoku]